MDVVELETGLARLVLGIALAVTSVEPVLGTQVTEVVLFAVHGALPGGGISNVHVVAAWAPRDRSIPTNSRPPRERICDIVGLPL